MAESEGQTEAPSARRLEQAREEGNVALSREALSFSVLLAGLMMTSLYMPSAVKHSVTTLQSLMFHSSDASLTPGEAAEIAIRTALALAVPFGAAVASLTLGVGLLQTGFLFRPDGAMPDLKRLSPMKGLGNILGGTTLMEGLKSLGKCLVFCAVIVWQGNTFVHGGEALVGMDIANLMTRLMRALTTIGATFVIAQLAIAGFDIFWGQRRRLSKLRMSRQEIRDEFRQNEGDPHIKAKLRQIRARIARQRMMEAVKTATVVVTNPTHYAVALTYERSNSGAPRIVAKGADDVATRIRTLAAEHRVPVISNPPLARALFTLPLDTEVPVEHFKIVASIISYVWRLKRQNAAKRPIL